MSANELPSATGSDGGDPLFGNRASDLFRQAMHPASPAPSPANPRWIPPTPEEAARLLPQFQITGMLGHGGMGAVYRGMQVSLNRVVAVKILPAELTSDAGFVERFRREAQTLARLQHPGIVTVYDFGQTAEGHLYFVMEYVDGMDLQRILHGPGLNPDQALDFTVQICEALHSAHLQGVVHRDIKPANVLVTRHGRAKLADFGLARPFSPGGEGSSAASLIAGTPDYMAPEQWDGKADHRSDIFALGVMLYEMLTGTKPKGAFPLPSQCAKIDARLDEVVIKALRQEPESRYQQVSELRSDVDRIRTSKLDAAPAAPVPGRRSKKKSGGWVGWALLVAVLVITAGLIVFFVTSPSLPGSMEVSASAEAPAARDLPVVSVPTAVPSAPAAEPVPGREPVPVSLPIPTPAPDVAPAPELVAVSAPPEPVRESVAVVVPVPIPEAAPTPAPVATPIPAAEPPATPFLPTPAPPPPTLPLIQTFSEEAPNLMAWCLAPLEEEVPNSIRQNLTFLREDLIDEGRTKPAASLDAYRAAFYLCEALIGALDERNRALVAAGYRAAQADADMRVSNSQLDARRNYQMSWPQYHREESQRAALREKETRGADLKKAKIPVDWVSVTSRTQSNLDRLYRQMRAALRG